MGLGLRLLVVFGNVYYPYAVLTLASFRLVLCGQLIEQSSDLYIGETRGEYQVVETYDAPFFDHGTVQLPIGPYAFVGVIAVNEENV